MLANVYEFKNKLDDLRTNLFPTKSVLRAKSFGAIPSDVNRDVNVVF
jgi:hypothetical protein